MYKHVCRTYIYICRYIDTFLYTAYHETLMFSLDLLIYAVYSLKLVFHEYAVCWPGDQCSMVGASKAELVPPPE